MRLVWSSDVHLDRMDQNERTEFKEQLQELAPDGFILAGDIGEADSVVGFLEDFCEALPCPIYFVLGNHDFWDSSFEQVKTEIRKLVNRQPRLHWLTENDIVAINSTTALIGTDGWSDAGFGKLSQTGTVPQDFNRIKDLKILLRESFESALNELGKAAAKDIKDKLSKAVSQYEQIYLVTHVPPFREAALDRSRRICDDSKIPFYACRAAGEEILDIMKTYPERHLTILCGHTHENCEVEIAPNIKVKVLNAGYGTWYPPGILKF